MYASYPRQTYFDMPSHVFRFCILTKLNFGIIVKNYDIYIYASCILDFYPYATCFKVFKYHVFVFG